MDRYTVIYEGDPSGVKILSGEPAPGRAVGVVAGDLADLYHREDIKAAAEVDALRAELRQALTEVEEAGNLLAGAGLKGMASIYRSAAKRIAATLTPSAAP